MIIFDDIRSKNSCIHCSTDSSISSKTIIRSYCSQFYVSRMDFKISCSRAIQGDDWSRGINNRDCSTRCAGLKSIRIEVVDDVCS